MRANRLAGAMSALVVLSVPAAEAAGGSSKGQTLGFVITDLRYALVETPDAKEECPDGLQIGEVAQFKAWPGHLEHMARFGGTTQNRGPNGEMANYVPLAVTTDVYPFRELRTSKGFGLNLDGTQDGHATPTTLAHGKFTSADGEKVDNQMARVLGCVLGWRKTGFMAEFHSKEIETQPYNRSLIELSGVDSESDDPEVQVTIYKGLDRLLRTPDGSGFIPFMSHRIDPRAAELTFRMHGRIRSGVLETDPIPLFRMGMRQIEILGERRIRGMRLRLKLGPEGAAGLMAGYEPIDTWWNIQSKSPGSDVGRYSPAQLYAAALRYADGYPDPKSGKATAISVAYKISAVRALIVHPGVSARTAVAAK